jgi:hypothetical protein
VNAAYDDDRPGMMRIHVAQERARLACITYGRDSLRAIAASHGMPSGYRLKSELAQALALAGIIRADGSAR